MDERQVKLYGGSLRISTSGKLDQSRSRMRTPTSENHTPEQRKMDCHLSTPRRKPLEPYVPPHRRHRSPINYNNVDSPNRRSKQNIVKPFLPTSYYSNSELNNSSECTDSKLEYSAFYNNKDFSDASSSNEHIEVNYNKRHGSVNKYKEFDKRPITIKINNNIIAERVLKLVDSHVNTEFKAILDELYEEAYGEIIPPEFLSRWMFSVTLKENTENSTTNRKLSDLTKQMELLQTKTIPDCLELDRLEKEFWIHIHSCKSVSKLWGVIVDSNHLGQVEKLSNQMQSWYGMLTTPNNRIIQNSYYALFDGSWHRVKCLECHDSTATVLFIDRGDDDEVPVNRLHELSSRFCSLPAQAVRMALSGLEIFADFDELQSILMSELYEKNIFAEVTVVAEEYLSVQLYVTNDNGEGINANELIMNQMLEKLLDPKLYIQTNNIVPAYISCLDERIYIQLNISSFKYFNLLIEKAIDEQMITEDCKRQVVVRHEISKIYFVKSNRDEKWYRGKIIKFMNDNEMKVFLIDVGSTTEVNRENIISLEKVSNILAKYPPQAIEVQLDQIPIVGCKILSRLQNVISKNRILHVKFVTVADNNNVSIVQLLKKSESNFFTSINDALLFLNEEISSNKNGNVELAETKQPIDTSSNKDFSTSSVNLTKSSKTALEAGEKKMLNINKDRISKIREKHKNTQEEKNGYYTAMYLSSVLKAPKIPEDYFDIHVFMSSDPSNFVIQLLRNKTLKFNKMICKMSEACRTYQGPQLTCDSIKVGQLYACKSSENDNRHWCRAYVIDIKDKKTAVVYCCDYGSNKTVDISNLVPLENEFYELPYQAVWAELNGVKPTSKEWTVVACLKFQELTQSKNFVCRVVGRRNIKPQLEKSTKTPVTQEVIYSLELIDTSSNSEDINIADLLVKYGMAERC